MVKAIKGFLFVFVVLPIWAVGCLFLFDIFHQLYINITYGSFDCRNENRTEKCILEDGSKVWDRYDRDYPDCAPWVSEEACTKHMREFYICMPPDYWQQGDTKPICSNWYK